MCYSLQVSPSVFVRRLEPQPSEIFDSFWVFAGERQAINFKRLAGQSPPWTKDPILAEFKFTNAYRASDRVSQYLIKNVIYDSPHESADLVFRVLLFKIFNRIDTWEWLRARLGEIKVDSIKSAHLLTEALETRWQEGAPLYSPAYIIPPASKSARKHTGHIELLDRMVKDHLDGKIQEAKSLRVVFDLLASYRSVGPFLAFQWAMDLNYSRAINFSEMDFVVAGPGALRGLKRCFLDLRDYSPSEAIRWVTERQEIEFTRRDVAFQTLWGRPLQLVDCQNLFCEIDKYSRVAFPRSDVVAGGRIKQRFRQSGDLPRPWYPPKWKLNSKIRRREQWPALTPRILETTN